jgi:steroid delta-isomerase-like uncharacterized protein
VVRTDESVAVVSRFMEEVLGSGKTPSADQVRGIAGLEEFLNPFHTAFPDLRFTVEEVIGEEENVVVLATGQATHLGEFEGIPPGGQTITFGARLVFRLDNGKIVGVRVDPEEGPIWDQLHRVAESGQPWYKQHAFGLWEKEGGKQIAFLKEQGLKPQHYFLDVGCGTLRGGVKVIPYLEAGHYYGVDDGPEVLIGARQALKEAGLQAKEPHLVEMADFDFPSLQRRFDYALARAVFTDIPLSPIIRCIMNIDKVLVPGGTFYATFWENKEGKFNLNPIDQSNYITYFDRYPYHYDFGTFEWICEGTGLRVEYLGPWAGEGSQKVLKFVKK